MANVDTSIYNVRQFTMADPLEQAAKALQVRGALNQNDLFQYQLSSAKRSDETQQKLLDDLQKAGGDVAAQKEALIRAGKVKEAAELEKVGLETDKARQEVEMRAVAAHRDALSGVNDPEAAAQWVMAGYRDPTLSQVFRRLGVTPEQSLSRIPADPQGFQQWKQQAALGATKYIEQNKPHITTQNLGGTERLVATPGLGGAPEVLSSTERTTSPDAQLADTRQREAQAETRRHNRAIEGDPEQIETMAQGIARGDLAPLSSFALSKPSGQAIMGRVMQIHNEAGTTFDPTAFATRQRTENDAAVGKMGQTIKSFNVGLSHLDSLSGLIDAMKSGDTRMLNRASQSVQTQLGLSAAPTNFEAAKQVVGNEIVKAIVGAGGGVGDREKAQETIDKASSPALLRGVIDTYKDLMVGQLKGLEGQYKAGGGRKDFRENFLSPESRRLVESHQQPKGADVDRRVELPGGRTMVFPTPAAAKKFREEAGL